MSLLNCTDSFTTGEGGFSFLGLSFHISKRGEVLVRRAPVGFKERAGGPSVSAGVRGSIAREAAGPAPRESGPVRGSAPRGSSGRRRHWGRGARWGADQGAELHARHAASARSETAGGGAAVTIT